MKYEAAMTFDEISQALELPLSTVKRTYIKALRKLTKKPVARAMRDVVAFRETERAQMAVRLSLPHACIPPSELLEPITVEGDDAAA